MKVHKASIFVLKQPASLNESQLKMMEYLLFNSWLSFRLLLTAPIVGIPLSKFKPVCRYFVDTMCQFRNPAPGLQLSGLQLRESMSGNQSKLQKWPHPPLRPALLSQLASCRTFCWCNPSDNDSVQAHGSKTPSMNEHVDDRQWASERRKFVIHLTYRLGLHFYTQLLRYQP